MLTYDKVAPEKIVWFEGDRCYGLWEDGLYYPGRITAVHKNGSCNIRFDDGVELKNTRDILDHDNIGSSSEEEAADSKDENDDAKGRAEKSARREARRQERKDKKEKRAALKKERERTEQAEEKARSPLKRKASDESDAGEKRKLVNAMDLETLRSLAVKFVSLEDLQETQKEAPHQSPPSPAVTPKKKIVKSPSKMKDFAEGIKNEIASFAHWKFKKGTGVSHNATPLVQRCSDYPLEAFAGLAPVIDFICSHLDVDDSYGDLGILFGACDSCLHKICETLDSDDLQAIEKCVREWDDTAGSYSYNFNETLGLLIRCKRPKY